jgi:hypothetical protein
MLEHPAQDGTSELIVPDPNTPGLRAHPTQVESQAAPWPIPHGFYHGLRPDWTPDMGPAMRFQGCWPLPQARDVSMQRQPRPAPLLTGDQVFSTKCSVSFRVSFDVTLMRHLRYYNVPPENWAGQVHMHMDAVSAKYR